MLKTSDFYYELPKELIAQTPAQPRDSSRLMVIDRKRKTVEHRHFYDITEYLKEGDCLIVNDSRVLPARIYGTKKTGARVEFLLLSQSYGNVWECLSKPGKKAREGDEFSFGDVMKCRVKEVLENGNRLVEFECEENFYSALDKVGQMPLPPYITKKTRE